MTKITFPPLSIASKSLILFRVSLGIIAAYIFGQFLFLGNGYFIELEHFRSGHERFWLSLVEDILQNLPSRIFQILLWVGLFAPLLVLIKSTAQVGFAVIAALLILTFSRYPGLSHFGDKYILVFSLYSAFIPWKKISWNNLRIQGSVPTVMLLQLFLIYFSNLVNKLNSGWFAGINLSAALSEVELQTPFGKFIADSPQIASSLNFGTPVLLTLILVFLLLPRWHWAAFVVRTLYHLSSFVFLKLDFLPLAGIAALLLCLPFSRTFQKGRVISSKTLIGLFAFATFIVTPLSLSHEGNRPHDRHLSLSQSWVGYGPPAVRTGIFETIAIGEKRTVFLNDQLITKTGDFGNLRTYKYFHNLATPSFKAEREKYLRATCRILGSPNEVKLIYSWWKTTEQSPLAKTDEVLASLKCP